MKIILTAPLAFFGMVRLKAAQRGTGITSEMKGSDTAYALLQVGY
jgi:hypothetical protein